MKNYVELKFSALSENESFARVCAGAFATMLNPTLNEIADIKTAVSEAVSNCVIHAYDGKDGEVLLRMDIDDQVITIEISDFGCGISDVKQAMEPMFSGKPEEERSGMGFTVMQTFMDEISVHSNGNEGTRVKMHKRIGRSH